MPTVNIAVYLNDEEMKVYMKKKETINQEARSKRYEWKKILDAERLNG